MDTNKMRDLKSLAETCLPHQSLRFMRSHGALYIRNDSGIVFDVHQNRSFPELMAQSKDYADFVLACTPATVLALLAEVDRLATSRSKKERELEQELEVWRNGPSCWTCGDTGDVHDITGEWRGECDCLSAQLISANRERDQLKAENEALRESANFRAIQSLRGDCEELRKDAERYRFVRNPIGTSSPLAIWNEGKMPLFSGMADAVVDEFMAKEMSHD